jgi:hypothetical protein
MLLTHHFVFVHFLKSGGTFIKLLVAQNAPESWGCRDLDGHPAIADIPATHSALPRFGFVRNPWDWYVSIYHYFTYVANDPLFNAISNERRLGFTETMLRAFDAEPFASAGMSPLQYFFCKTYTAGEACDFLRFEGLRTELHTYLRRLPVIIPATLEAAICDAPDVNRSPRQEYRVYYTTRLIDEIAKRDEDYIARFDYRF